jgi:PKD repeat protein
VFNATQSTDNDPAFAATANFTWSLTDAGRQVTLHGPTANYRFESAGTYEVTLTVRDAAGNADSAELVVTVEPAPAFDVRVAVVIALVVAAGAVAGWVVLRGRRAPPS